MAISEDRFSLAQKSEREGGDRLWKDNLAKQMKAVLIGVIISPSLENTLMPSLIKKFWTSGAGQLG